ncbi:hypothetical protein CISG_09695 [Coccidioides immitis RMSCC 3703]|uniref:Uncharacterized protein n=1 Tax=Coccidioides immitis RMSCC 3703 TaxID=454286 RepID=A0A0J8QJJ7_COCIT|nr:hypothetical protein CISG_09695 [Coccidioides immitis RMSCC 3703]
MPFIGVPRTDKEASKLHILGLSHFFHLGTGWRLVSITTKGSLLVSDLNGSQYRRNPGSKGWPTCIANFKSQDALGSAWPYIVSLDELRRRGGAGDRVEPLGMDVHYPDANGAHSVALQIRRFLGAFRPFPNLGLGQRAAHTAYLKVFGATSQ